jgi:hypothetical protein
VLFFLTGFLSWFPMAYYFIIVGSEFTRAKKAGELPDVSTGARGGIPVVVLFTDRLPAVRIQRLRFVFWFSVFLGSLVAGGFVGTAFGPNW